MIVAVVAFALGVLLGHIYGSHAGYMEGVKYAAKEIYDAPKSTLDR